MRAVLETCDDAQYVVIVQVLVAAAHRAQALREQVMQAVLDLASVLHTPIHAAMSSRSTSAGVL